MSLLDEFMEAFRFMDRQHAQDAEGGYTTVYAEGAEFPAACTLDTSMEARMAESNGVTSVYTITTPKSVSLSYGDVVKRLSDGRYFRITSNSYDKRSPASASFDVAQVTAEKWELTT